VKGVHDAEDKPPLSAGIPSADCGSVSRRSAHFRTCSRVRTIQAIRDWIKQADLDTGKRSDGLTTDEKEELSKLRRELKQVKLEREILAKAAAWFARETDVIATKSSRS